MALLPKWSGTDKAVPLHEFFEAIESTEKIGNWTQEDMVRIATLKLTDEARAFYNGTLELHDQRVTWAAYLNGCSKSVSRRAYGKISLFTTANGEAEER